MRIVKGLYTISTFIIASIFLVAYYYSGMEFCLLPVGLVLFDYVRAIRNTVPDRPVLRPVRSPYIEFITEEEFRV